VAEAAESRVAVASILLLALGLVLSFYVAWCLGANDAANPTECAVGSGATTLRQALVLFSAFAALGALTHGFMVIKTIGTGVVQDVTLLGSVTVILSACLWITVCTWKGLPISTTHSIIGSVLGYGFTRSLLYGGAGVRWGVMGGIGIAWVASPVLAALLAALLYRIMVAWLPGRRNPEQVAKHILMFALCFSAFAFGANDVGNATGVFFSVASKTGEIPRTLSLLGLAVLGSTGIAVGAFTWGYRVINTVGFKITRLDYVMGGAAELSNATAVYLFTTLPFLIFGWGMPISTTLASVGSVIGVGMARNFRTVSRGMVLRIVAGWLFTVPSCAVISGVSFWLAAGTLGP